MELQISQQIIIIKVRNQASLLTLKFFRIMGKKSKKTLETNEPSDQSEDLLKSEKPVTPADDPELIPYHSRQAAFAIIYLLFFSVLMFTLPFGAFYGTRHVLHEHFHIDGFANTCWSVGAAVLTVNVVIALYAISGYIEAKKEEDHVNQHAESKKSN